MLVPLIFTTLIFSVASQSGHPEFDPTMEQVVLEEGTLAKVECEAKGELPLTYKWHNQTGVEIPSDANEDIFTRRSDRGCSLIFGSVKQNHAGLYSCSATNKHGTASKPYDIIVNSTSGNITTNETAKIVGVKVINITDVSIEFVVATTGKQDSFYIRYKEKLDKEEKSVQIKSGDKAIVKDLVPAGRYEFRFQIEDPSRVKLRVDPYMVIMLPGVPDVIFRSIKDGMVAIEWFRSIDDFSRDTIEEYELSYNTVQQVGGRYWEPRDCVTKVTIPRRSCYTGRHTIAGLEKGVYLEIRLRLRTSSGYGKPFINKIYTQ